MRSCAKRVNQEQKKKKKKKKNTQVTNYETSGLNNDLKRFIFFLIKS